MSSANCRSLSFILQITIICIADHHHLYCRSLSFILQISLICIVDHHHLYCRSPSFVTCRLLSFVLQFTICIADHNHLYCRSPSFALQITIIIGVYFHEIWYIDGGFPSQAQCTQFAKLGVFLEILPIEASNLALNWVFFSENSILKGPKIV